MNDINNDNQQSSDREIRQENGVQIIKKLGFNNLQMFCILGILIFFSTIISAIIFATTVKIKGNGSKRNNGENTNSEACIANCLYCEEDFVCTECNDGYEPSYYNDGTSIKECLKTERCKDNSETCLICKSKSVCSKCNAGYFLPSDKSDIPECQKCSVHHCGVCSGNTNADTCQSCEVGFDEEKDDDGVINKCLCNEGEGVPCIRCNDDKTECISCDVGYKLDNGRCIINYSIKAVFEVQSRGENVKLFPYSLLKYWKELIIDGVEKSPTTNYEFDEIGQHTVYYLVDLSFVSSVDELFGNNDYLVSVAFTPLFGSSNVNTMEKMFQYCTNLISVDFSSIDTSSVTSTYYMFLHDKKLTYVNMENLDFSSLKKATYMFSYCHSLTSINIDLKKATKIETMEGMFIECKSLISIDLSNVQSLKLNRINSMLKKCNSLTSVNLENFITDQVIYMNNVFESCTSLTSIDLSSFNTRNVRLFSQMFMDCKALTSIDLSNFDITGITNRDGVYQLFKDCSQLAYINIEKFDYNIRESSCFGGLPSAGTIVVNSNRVELIKQLFAGKSWNVITNSD